MSTSTDDNYVFVCDCAEGMRSACLREVFFKASGEKQYCVLHYPGPEKAAQFREALDRKLKVSDFDFSGVWFPEVSFSGQTLNKASFREAKFNSLVRFSQTKFGESVDFSQAQFGESDFSHAEFSGTADFRGANLSDGRFQYAKFAMADFTGASFGLANFVEAEFKSAHFANAQFHNDAFLNPIRVSEQTNFRSAKFFGKAYFGKAELKAAYFGETEFATLVDFGEVHFANSNFEKAQFKDRVNFGGAQFMNDVIFKETLFKEADFKKAEFSGNASFDDSEFSDEAQFEETKFKKDTLFKHTEFGKKAYFYKTRFGPEASDKKGASLKPPLSEPERTISFGSARFKDMFVFESCELVGVRLHLDSATAEQPARMVFESVNLRPIWLIGFDLRSVQFIKVRWRELRRGRIIAAEIGTLEQENVSTPYESLEIVCRQLAFNAEENNRYEEAADFRLVANEAHRRETWHNLRAEPWKWESWKSLNPMLWLYGAVSGYGERAWQAAGVLLLICFLFAFIFFFGQRSGQWWRLAQNPSGNADPKIETGRVASQAPQLWDFGEAVLYSAYVMALQKPEPLPANKRAKILVLIETVIGPVQLALLALAIRRKFMR